MTRPAFNVLFLCTANSARSILAEGILRQDGRGRFNAFSAGSQPRGTVNPFALKVLESYGYPADGYRSKGWDNCRPGCAADGFHLHRLRHGGGESCPVWPGHPATAHWGIEDPARVEATNFAKEAAFVEAFRFLKNRISSFTALPLESIDRMAMTHHLTEIGRQEGATLRAKG